MPLLAELKRRHVFRIAAAYVVGAWIAIQVGATVAPLLGMPDWVPRLVVLVAIIGFPIAVVLAWIYDLGERGIERTAPQAVAEQAAPAAPTVPVVQPAPSTHSASARSPRWRSCRSTKPTPTTRWPTASPKR